MDFAGYVINAVLVEGRSVAEVAAAHGISSSWVYELLARYRRDGDTGWSLVRNDPRPHRRESPMRLRMKSSRCASCSPRKASTLDRKRSTGTFRRTSRAGAVGFDDLAGAVPTRVHRPSTPQATEASFVRFEAQLPNECWQADTTHWRLEDGTDVEVLNVIDDHSRLVVASHAFRTTKAGDVVATFYEAAAIHGFPASMLTDNGAIFTAAQPPGPARWSPNSTRSASSTSTPAPTTRRPAAKSNASIKP